MIAAFLLASMIDNQSQAFTLNPISSRCCTALQSTAAAVTEIQFTSLPTQVYIEDTDAYGIVYMPNYVRAYERALHGFGASGASELLSKQDWSIVQVDKQRFKKAFALGESFIVTGTRRSHSSVQEVWVMEMTNPIGVVCNSAIVTIASELPSPPPLNCDRALPPIEFDLVLYRDEFDINLPGRIPLRNVMRPFEHARSNGLLGGPGLLKRLQDEDGIIFIVTSIDEVALIQNDAAACRPGEPVTVTTAVQFRSRGMTRFLHTLWSKDDAGVPQRMAQAVVVLMTLDKNTKKAISVLPDWLYDRLSEVLPEKK